MEGDIGIVRKILDEGDVLADCIGEVRRTSCRRFQGKAAEDAKVLFCYFHFDEVYFSKDT